MEMSQSMEARTLRAALLAASLVVSMGARFQTPNFIVETADPRLARQFAQTAEKQRRELAVAWLGKAMPDWSQPCVITVHVGPHLGAGGATSFVFDRGHVFGWRMNIQGSHQRILDSVLPHEITHMIFASHFRQPLPRWADEGGATSVEHTSERAKHRKIPTWDEAIEVIVSTNLESRSKSSGSKGGQRGSRRRGRGGKRG